MKDIDNTLISDIILPDICGKKRLKTIETYENWHKNSYVGTKIQISCYFYTQTPKFCINDM